MIEVSEENLLIHLSILNGFASKMDFIDSELHDFQTKINLKCQGKECGHLSENGQAEFILRRYTVASASLVNVGDFTSRSINSSTRKGMKKPRTSQYDTRSPWIAKALITVGRAPKMNTSTRKKKWRSGSVMPLRL